MTVVCLVPLAGQARAPSPPKTVWVDMRQAQPTYSASEFTKALRLRLPEWEVRTLPAGSPADGCPGNSPEDVVVAIRTDEKGRSVLAVTACDDGAVRLTEPLDTNGSEADALRQAAVLVSMTVTAPPEDASESPATAAPTKTPSPFERSRTTATIGLLPGFTVAPKAREVAFTGSGELGALLVNRVWIKAGVDASTPFVGKAVKKNENVDEGIDVAVTDIGFWLGVAYRFVLSRRWYLEAGAAGRYTHAMTRDLTESKFAVEEVTPAARGAAVAWVAGGFAIGRMLAVCLSIRPAVTFGERSYNVRGEEAVTLGYATLNVGVGVQLFL